MQFHGVGPSDAINTDLYPSLLLRETRKLVSKQADQTARLVVRFTPNAFGANDQPTERSALLSSSGSMTNWNCNIEDGWMRAGWSPRDR